MYQSVRQRIQLSEGEFQLWLKHWLSDLQSKNVRLNSQKVVETFAYLKQKRTIALAITKQWPRSSTE